MSDRHVARWYPLIDHPVQVALINEDVRFKVVPAGRRSGKTERAKRFIVKQALAVPDRYFVAAPTRDQVKRIYWQDLKLLSPPPSVKNVPLETELTINYVNGSSITLVGLDQPQRIEGDYWGGGIIDEIADTKPGTWENHVSPALDTVNPTRPNYRAWAWLIGVPDGLNHYYDLAEYARSSKDPDWKLYTWKSSDILPSDVIEAAKRRMPRKAYLQEYEASFQTASGRIYEDYSERNYTSETIEPHEQLMWAHDFNYSPMSSVIAVKREGSYFCLDEIVLISAVARQSALEFVDRYKDHGNKVIKLYGDPAGKAGEKHGQQSNYTEMEAVLRDHGWTVERKVKMSAPAIRDRQNAVRSKLLNAMDETSLYVNTVKCPYMHKGLATCELKEGSSFIEEASDYQHITTALGYMIEYEDGIKPVTTASSVSLVTLGGNSWMSG
jgi:hypothetical protein